MILTDRPQKSKARFPKKIKDYQKPFLKNSAFCRIPSAFRRCAPFSGSVQNENLFKA
ncbi:hypothetical protein AVDCRST_MAG84-2700 [uncultured Microcoleus sp.]|uniref:Uncharacterized protein n=1 Tax=uncultured Microcoleus sp. TaxID=259945 RepID=A0A6J4M1Y6_9CYAN|nr:hypothetical protein AVDCRST_MAG84-2700 [uncultured Microcoleus sp.]